MKAIEVREFGGLEVLTYTDVPVPSPGAGQVLVRVRRSPVYSQEICRKSDRASKRCWRPIAKGAFIAGKKKQAKSINYRSRLIFRQICKNPRNVHSSRPAISSFNRVIHYFGGLLWRTVQSRVLLTIF
jgi:hypothetical protein